MNAINVISPYKYHGVWVFDDARVGLVQEPFVAGADTMIDRAVALMPKRPYADHQHRLDWHCEEAGGNWYHSEELKMIGWLCPALLLYFNEAPRHLYVEVKARS